MLKGTKMLFTDNPGSGLERVMQKIKEWIIAAQLEKRYTKNEILTMYLNRFDWVNNAVGIKSAAQVYFNKKPIELTIEKSAFNYTVLKVEMQLKQALKSNSLVSVV